MDRSACAVPSWGAFRGIADAKSVAKQEVTPHSAPRDDVAHAASNVSPAFNLNDVPVDAETSFYADVGAERNEIEFDALGEGALRQIGRSFISVLGSVSAIGLAVATVIWISSESSVQSVSTVASNDSENTTKIEDQSTVPGYFVREDADLNIPVAVDTSSTFEIDLDIPVPSVIEVSQSDRDEPTSVVNIADDKNPVPISRQIALASFESVEDGPLAQGSDDESVFSTLSSPALLDDSGKWISVLVPVDRPTF